MINFDPPSTPETDTHRIGRTGRSEATGKACTLVTSADRDWVRDTEKVLGEAISRREQSGYDSGFGLDEFEARMRTRGGSSGKPSNNSNRGRSNGGAGRSNRSGGNARSGGQRRSSASRSR